MSMLERILEPDGIRMCCQPILQLQAEDRILCGIECLARGPFATPFESPSVLFDYVRRKQAEAIVDRHVLDLALGTYRDLPAELRLAINVHASSLGQDPEFADHIHDLATYYGHAAERVTIEIVEHTPATQMDIFAANLQQLRARGYRVALDDVGIGHSNFKMIVDVHPEYFKIDSYLVQGVSRDRVKDAVLAAIITLARHFGSSVIAEGVEEVADLRALQAMGVDMVQGYLLSPPISREELFCILADVNWRTHVFNQVCRRHCQLASHASLAIRDASAEPPGR